MNKQDVADIRCAAFEGGINYWADILPTEGSARDEDLNYLGAWKIVERGDFANDDEVHILTDEKLRQGIKLAAHAYHMSVAAFIENHDAGMADNAVQLALFGKVIYG